MKIIPEKNLTPLEQHIEEFENYWRNTKKSIQNKEYHSPQGYLYCIQQECNEIIRILKTLQSELV